MTEPDRDTKDRMAVRWTVTACLIPALERHDRADLVDVAARALAHVDPNEFHEAGRRIDQIANNPTAAAVSSVARLVAASCYFAAWSDDDLEIPTTPEAANCARALGLNAPDLVLVADGTPVWRAVELVELLGLLPGEVGRSRSGPPQQL